MADKTNTYELSVDWSESARYTASEDIDIGIGNPSVGAGQVVRYARTDDDNVPTLSITSANVLQPGETKGMQLLNGERIWFAGVAGHLVTLDT